ncbi:mannitol dehydrogenase [Caballeronia arationis]|jgi:fructuronate reductase|uniref:Fructuronate reductase n=1 Tax=Caballeronia arationis TaxID=1777142 RepID=A0A7Z7I5P4_9BURK|nr:mannitol dehydrogenase family protein [Caballeronia arationis]SAK52977.1 mannitol dehydrogenase [Caballeronia arationis]SOE65584.1 fructuronate reductase [Caballeronia arationis]
MNAKSTLCRETLASIEPHLLSPEWREPRVGIVHLGIGNFHRAHEAVYTEEAMLAAGGDWGICGVTLQGDVAKRDALMAQDGLYSVIERGPDGVRVTVVRALKEVLAMPYDRTRLFALLADENVRIVSLTVTEKGYCRDTKTGDVDRDHPGIAHDLTHPQEPSTVPGILSAALALRREAGTPPFTVLSCDNLSHNGAALKQAVVSFARARDAALADWIDTQVAFPSTMVDRIVPSTTDADREAASHALNMEDAAPGPCEPFRQWVIEDRFPAGRPAWEKAGAQLVDDVMPFEIAKLRMLNGTHSTLAYLSMLAGFATIDEAIAHAPLKKLIHAMMTQEIAPTLDVPPSFDVLAYRDALLARYANAALKHRTAQIAMDGSQKIPPRLLATIEARLNAGQSIERLALAVAAWLVFLRGHADDGTRYEISDPMAARLTANVPDEPEQLVETMLAIKEVFPPELARRDDFRRPLHAAIVRLQGGARAAIEHYAALA